MNKKQVADLLKTNHAQFIDLVSSLSDLDLCYAPEGKWSAVQQLDHIVKSVSPVNMAMRLPKFILKWRFGVANRSSKTYEGLTEKYIRKLLEGGRASGRFVPPIVTADQKEKLLAELKSLVKSLSNRTETYSEEALDKYILPHPLLGKLTLREMLYFTAYHVQHHRELVQKGLDTRINIE
ncbi:MAG: DinB family protein [Bacteroidota bacterium]